jgi:hypothetical protein
MNKFMCMLTAGATALVLASGMSAAADKSKSRPAEEPPRASENQPGDPAPVKTAPEQAAQDQEYMAALKKCDSLKGGEKQKCVDAAERKFSRM